MKRVSLLCQKPTSFTKKQAFNFWLIGQSTSLNTCTLCMCIYASGITEIIVFTLWYVTIEVTELIVLCNLILSTYEQDQKQPRFYFKGLALEFTQVQVLRQKADRNKVFVIFKITSHNTFDLFFYVQGMRRTCKNGFVPISLFK